MVEISPTEDLTLIVLDGGAALRQQGTVALGFLYKTLSKTSRFIYGIADLLLTVTPSSDPPPRAKYLPVLTNRVPPELRNTLSSSDIAF